MRVGLRDLGVCILEDEGNVTELEEHHYTLLPWALYYLPTIIRRTPVALYGGVLATTKELTIDVPWPLGLLS